MSTNHLVFGVQENRSWIRSDAVENGECFRRPLFVRMPGDQNRILCAKPESCCTQANRCRRQILASFIEVTVADDVCDNRAGTHQFQDDAQPLGFVAKGVRFIEPGANCVWSRWDPHGADLTYFPRSRGISLSHSIGPSTMTAADLRPVCPPRVW